MMPFDQLPEVIFDLLAVKSYQQLSASERKMVDGQLSAEEYNELHQVLQDFHEVDQQITLPLEDRVDLPPRLSFATRFLHYPIPAYQVAAGVLLLIGSFFILYTTLPQATAEERYHYVRTGTTINQDSYPDSLVFEL